MRNKLRYLPCAVLLALLPVMILRDYTPSNELRYLSIADEAIENGSFFAFTNQGEPYADKPPLYLWIVMLGRWLFGAHRMWFLSLFSVVPALVILRTMDRWVRGAFDEQNRLTAMTVLMSSGLFLGLAVVLRMDMLMCMFITFALYLFWKIYAGTASSADRLLFPLSVFLALFTKGPVGVLVPLVTTVVFLLLKRQYRLLGECWGWRSWGVLLAGCAVWFSAVWLEGGTEYLDNLLFHQTVDRAVDAFHHKAPVWYYLVSMWYSLAPWSLLVIGVIAVALVRRVRLTELEQFFLTAILSTLVMLSAFSSKLAVYLAPAFPFFVYLAMSLLARMRRNGWQTAAVAFPAVIWTLAPAALLVLPHVEPMPVLANGWIVAAAVLLGLSGIGAAVLLARCQTLHRPIRTLAAGLFVALFVGGMALPQLNPELGYGALCADARQAAAEGDAYCVWKIRRAENMDVYLGQDVATLTTDEILAGSCGGNCVLMLPEAKLARDGELSRFLAGLQPRRSGKYLIYRLAQNSRDGE